MLLTASRSKFLPTAMESPHEAKNYHNVTPLGQTNVGVSIQHFERMLISAVCLSKPFFGFDESRNNVRSSVIMCNCFSADIKQKERKAVQEELKFEMEENCRVEYDDLMDCQARIEHDYFSLWRCRKQQQEVWQCEKRYKDKTYRKKREIEIVEARQQQGEFN